MNPYGAAAVSIRPDLLDALGVAHRELGDAGSWLSGAERVAVAAEARQAWHCALCRERKAALSPYSVEGAHDSTGDLPDAWVEVIHRVVTDSGRLTRRWLDEALASGLSEDTFVEIVSVAIMTTVMDAFAFGIDFDPPALPTPSPGEPPRAPNSRATPGPGWVSTTAPENAGPELEEFYAGDRHFYIVRSLTLVPDEAKRFFALANPMYMEDPRVRELDGLDRGLTRAQIEFLAARCSALLGCYY